MELVEFNLNALQIVTFLVAVVSPLLVGLVTTRVTASGVKAWLLAGIAALTGLGAELISAITTGEIYDLGTGFITAITAFVVAVGMHYGLYKPGGATEKVQAIGAHTTP